MQTVKDERIERFTINVPSKALDETIVNDIMSMVTDTPGHTQLYFNIKDEESHTNVLLRSSKKQIEVSKSLVEYVDANDEMTYTVN